MILAHRGTRRLRRTPSGKKAAAVYYVDPAGSDSADGKTAATAWKTIGKVNGAALKSGARVYFKRGATFAGRLIPQTSGVIYGAYSTGERPIIDGSASSALYINDATVHHLRFEGIDFSGATGTNSTALCYTHDAYFYDCIFRDSGSKSGFAAYSNTGGDIYGITLDSCVFRNNYTNGCFIGSGDGTAGPHDCLLTNCTSYSNGHSNSADHGIYVMFGCVLDGCTAYSNSAAGIKVNCESNPDRTYTPIVRNCTSYNNYDGLYVGHDRALFVNNLVYGNTYQNILFDGDGDECEFYFNTFVNSTNASVRAIGINAATCTGNIFKNNLFIQDIGVVARSIIDINGSTADLASNNTFDYNAYFWNGAATGNILYDGTAGAAKNWNDWTAAGAEAHGTLLSAVPDFVSRYTDYQPIPSGNFLGKGLALAAHTSDRNGVARTSPPTPGCYDDPKPEKVYYKSAEVGNAGAAIVVVTFTATVYAASDYAAGVTIKVAGSAATISSAARQADTKVVHYTLSAAVLEGQTVTWEYAATSGQLGNSAGTYSMVNAAAQTVTNNVVNTLANITHETGDLSQYSTTSIDTNRMVASAASALNGTSYGCAHTFNGATETSGRKNLTSITNGICQLRLYFDPNSYGGTDGKEFTLVEIKNNADENVAILRVYAWAAAGPYRCYLRIYDDAGSGYSTASTAMSDAPHRIEINITRSSSSTANDGHAELWVDGTSIGTVTGKDNFDKFAQFAAFRVGKYSIQTGPTGTYYVDEIKVNNSGQTIGA